MSPKLRVSSALHLTLLFACGACAAGGGIRVSDVTPQAIPSLEAERSQRPQDASVLTRLGVAYFKAGRYRDARPVLDSAVARDPRDGVAAIYLGMTAEQLGDFAAARAAYQRFIPLAASSELKATAQQRLALVGRRELEYQARQALASEASLAAQPPTSNTVAVMPFSYSGRNPDIQPLTRGFAQLLVTDLAKSRQIVVLERERMQAMLDEMKLSDSARAQPATAVRSGHLLRAASVVQGVLADRPGAQLLAQAAVVNVASAGVQASANQQNPLSQLFDLEKGLAFSIFANLGIQLSPAEREAINQRPTQNLQAFLAYSRGLVAEDNGDFAAAAADFNQAVTLDPNFRAASQGAAAASDLSAASQQSVTQTEATVSQTATIQAPAPSGGSDALQQALGNGVTGVIPPNTALLLGDVTGQNQPTGNRNTTAETTGSEGGPPPTGVIVIIITRPL